MTSSTSVKPTGLILGAVLEVLAMIAFMLFVGIDHTIAFVGLCGILFGIALMRTAITPSDVNAAPGVDPDHARIASLNSLFPKAVIAAAVFVAIASLMIGTENVHAFARDVLGFDVFMTKPLLQL